MKRKTFVNRAMSTLLVALGGVCVMGCNKKPATTEYVPNVKVVSGQPDYSKYRDTNVMRLSAWVSPPPGNWGGKGNENFITDERYKELMESGLNSIYALYENNNGEATKLALEYASKYGINYYVRDTNTTFVDPIKMELEEGDWSNAASVKYYKDSPAFKGHLITDEPSADAFEKIANIKEFYNKEFPGKDFFVNLFPTYASNAQTGTLNYAEYIQKYIDIVKPEYISFDHYALMEDGYGKKKITDDCLYNHEVVATKCSDAGIYYMTFVQTMSYDSTSRCPNEEEIRWQVMTDMAYGSKGIQYFCYWTPIEWTEDKCTPAMISLDGERSDRYYSVKKVNSEIASMDEAYLDFTWTGTMALEGTLGDSTNKCYKLLENNLESHELIKSVTSTEDALVGTFKDSDERFGFMITNFEDPATKKNNEIKISFHKATKALIYHYGVATVVELNNGTLEYTLDPGDGIFVIPFVD